MVRALFVWTPAGSRNLRFLALLDFCDKPAAICPCGDRGRANAAEAESLEVLCHAPGDMLAYWGLLA